MSPSRPPTSPGHIHCGQCGDDLGWLVQNAEIIGLEGGGNVMRNQDGGCFHRCDGTPPTSPAASGVGAASVDDDALREEVREGRDPDPAAALTEDGSRRGKSAAEIAVEVVVGEPGAAVDLDRGGHQLGDLKLTATTFDHRASLPPISPDHGPLIEAEIVADLQMNLAAAAEMLDANQMVALRALAEQEARYVDALRAIWGTAR